MAWSSALASTLKGAKLVSSPLSRASETAVVHAEALGAGEVTCDMRLRERYFGLLEERSIDLHPCVWEKDRVCAHGLGIEAPPRVRDRVVSLIASLEAEHEGVVFAFITHSATAQITETWFRGMDPESHRELAPMRNGELRLMVANEPKPKS